MSTPTWDDGDTVWDGAGVDWDSVTRPTTPSLPPAPGTIYVPFLPSQTANFQFQATLDGRACIVIVTWCLFGERYYVNIYGTDTVLILSIPLIGSPNDFNISMTAGYFATKMVFRAASQNFEIFE